MMRSNSNNSITASEMLQHPTELAMTTNQSCHSSGPLACCGVYDDGILVWPTTEVNQTVTFLCPVQEEHVTYEMDLIRAKSITVTRTCLAPAMEQVDDQWGKGSYGDCSQYIKYLITRTDELGVRNHRLAILIFSGALVSLALLVLTLYIFVSFRSIQCSRLSVHKNLVIAFILYFISNIVMYEPMIFKHKLNNELNGTSEDDIVWTTAGLYDGKKHWVWNNISFNGLYAMQAFTKMASTNWLFNEGFYLHSRITTSIFDSDAPFLFFHSIGWGISGVCVFIWTVVMGMVYGYQNKWDHHNDYIWIIVGPMATVLVLNLIFLINIVRILVTKLRANSTPEADWVNTSPVNYLTGLQIARPQAARGRFVFPHGTDRMTALFWWKAMKAVGVLFGFLGLSNLVFFYNPNNRKQEQSIWEDAYLYTNSILQSSQGIVVSVLYCFCSPDVRVVIAKRLYRMKVRWRSRNLRRDNNRRFRESRRGLSETSLKFIRTSHAPVGASGVTSGCTIEEDRKIFDTRDHNLHRHPHRWPPRTSPEGSDGGCSSQQHNPYLERNNSKSRVILDMDTNILSPEESSKSNGHHSMSSTLKVWIHPQPSARVMVSDNAAAPSVGNVGRDQIQGVPNGPQHIQGVPNGPQYMQGSPYDSQHIQGVQQETFVLSTSVGNLSRDQIQGGPNGPQHIRGVPNGGPQHIQGVPNGSDQHIQGVQEAFVLSTLAATGLTS